MAKIIRREFAQLAKTFDLVKHLIAGLYLSEKLDGTRCIWDGGVTRGMETKSIPWANINHPKTGKPKKKVKPYSSGLWSRYGNPIMAPDWYLDQLPNCILDGELWAGRGNFQLCRSICAGDSPDPRFDQIKYAIYSAPTAARLFQPGLIKNSNFVCDVTPDFLDWYYKQNGTETPWNIRETATFQGELDYLDRLKDCNPDVVYRLGQVRLPFNEEAAKRAMIDFYNGVLAKGGEGIVVRNANAIWTPRRVNDLLKWKPKFDDEVIITGFTSGRLTDKGSKHLGRIGALITDFQGKRLELSGLTDAEREFATEGDRYYANEHPGKDMPSDTQGKHFEVGQLVTFEFRELSDAGIPKDAHYMRKRDVE